MNGNTDSDSKKHVQVHSSKRVAWLSWSPTNSKLDLAPQPYSSWLKRVNSDVIAQTTSFSFVTVNVTLGTLKNHPLNWCMPHRGNSTFGRDVNSDHEWLRSHHPWCMLAFVFPVLLLTQRHIHKHCLYPFNSDFLSHTHTHTPQPHAEGASHRNIISHLSISHSTELHSC